MADETQFDPSSSLEGGKLKGPSVEFPNPSSYFPTLGGVNNLNRPNIDIDRNVVRTHAVNNSIPKNNVSAKSVAGANKLYLDNFFQANQDKNAYGKIYSYNAGPDGNAFALMGYASNFAKQLGLNKEEIINEMMSSDYEHLLQVFDKHFGSFVILER